MTVHTTPWIVWIATYLVTVLTSGFVVRALLSHAGQATPEGAEGPGFVIGKLEDILVVTFVLLSAYTALALVFAAKNIVRRDADKEHESYYVLGTLANFTWAFILSVGAKMYLSAVGA